MPCSSTRPAAGRSNPAITRSVVVLPEPDGPRSVKNSPAAMSRSTPATATTSPYTRRIPVRRTAGASAPVSVSDEAGASVAKCLLQQAEPALELLVARREGRQKPDHVSVQAAGEEEQPFRIGGRSRRLRGVGRRIAQLE